MSSNTILQTIAYPDSGKQTDIEIKRQVKLVNITDPKDTHIDITNPDFDLYSIFAAQLLRTEQKFRALDEFFKLYLQAIVVLDSDNLDEAYINDHEKKILHNIIDSFTVHEASTPLEFKKLPLGKKALIKDNLCILKSDKIIILFRQADYDEQKRLLEKTSMLITIFNQSKKQ